MIPPGAPKTFDPLLTGRKLPCGAHNAQQEEGDGTVADPEER